MACVNPDGTLTSSAQAILAVLQKSNRPEGIARATGLPLYRVRSSLRELTQLGVVVESSGSYLRSDSGAPENVTARRGEHAAGAAASGSAGRTGGKKR